MTKQGTLPALRRRWYILLAGAVCVLAALAAVARAEGVYWTQVDVVLLPPSPPGAGNVLEGRRESLIHLAAIIDRELNPHGHPARLSSATATLYGAGVREGYSVAVVDTGNQWGSSFSRPVLTVEVVDGSPEEVRAVLGEVVGDIRSVLDERQQAAGVPPEEYVTLELAPTSPVVAYVVGRPTRAGLVIVVLGVWASVYGALVLDRALARRRGEPREADDLARRRGAPRLPVGTP